MAEEENVPIPLAMQGRRGTRRASFMLPESRLSRGSNSGDSTAERRDSVRRGSVRRPSTAMTPSSPQISVHRPSTASAIDELCVPLTDRSTASGKRRGGNKSLRQVPTKLREYEGENNDREELFFGKDYDLFVVQHTAEMPLLDRLTPDDIGMLIMSAEVLFFLIIVLLIYM